MDRQRRPMDEVFDSAEVRRRIAGTTTGGGRVTSATFRLVTTVKRGTASNLAPAWAWYPTVEAARAGAAALLREDRVLRVMIVRNEMAATCVEWCDR